jgi:hypothetical protein
MGIQGLLGALKSCIDRCHLSVYAGHSVAIDACEYAIDLQSLLRIICLRQRFSRAPPRRTVSQRRLFHSQLSNATLVIARAPPSLLLACARAVYLHAAAI